MASQVAASVLRLHGESAPPSRVPRQLSAVGIVLTIVFAAVWTALYRSLLPSRTALLTSPDRDRWLAMNGSGHGGSSEMDHPLREYRVLVTNEVTGAQEEVSVHAHGVEDAQVGALHAMFLDRAWRHASARVPHTVLDRG